MDNNAEKINDLSIRLENLSLKQQEFETEIKNLRQELRALQPGEHTDHVSILDSLPKKREVFPEKITPPAFKPIPQPQRSSFTDKFKRENIAKSDFEKFIGENLISKIGILILVIGVAIGAKLAIDKGLISPLTRIILAYLVGIGLMGFAIKLKAKYESFSAVLLSGSIAILYFVTYAAYAYYQLIPQALTFAMMVVFTGFTVVAAIKYNRQVIANIGLVGAYAIPFLLSDGSGNVVVLLTYIAIINLGILVLAFVKYWKSLFYLSFGLTWLIFLGWRIPLDDKSTFLKVSMLFSSIYFITFYVTNLAYKVIKKEIFEITDVIILLLNSFIFYGAGFWVLQQSALGGEILGLFTLGNAIIHFIVSVIIYKRKLGDKNLFYFILAMVITFITMAVPVQLNGDWVTIFWAVEASILFYLGRSKQIAIYEKLALPLILLAFISLLQDWFTSSDFYNYNDYQFVKPFFNIGFLSACIFIASFLWMFIVSRRKSETEEIPQNPKMRILLSYIVPTILIIVAYNTFRIEISHFFSNSYESTKINTSPKSAEVYFEYNFDYVNFGTVWNHIYTLFFVSALTYLNLKKIKSKELAVVNLVLNLFTILLFLTHGLYTLSELRESYISQSSKYFTSGILNILIRYISFIFFTFLIIICYQLSKSALFKVKFKTAFDYVLYLSILWILSSELLNILELNGLSTGYKLGLSILWGVYALILIGIGLFRNMKFLRIGAIVLFGITLIKLFFYDISSLDTISKTIVFVSLGVLLLIISFLYNKYKHLINDDVKTEN